jgi:hypothetical protein
MVGVCCLSQCREDVCSVVDEIVQWKLWRPDLGCGVGAKVGFEFY